MEEEQRLELIRFVHDTHRREVDYHRGVMYQVFQWTTGLLLAMGAGLIGIGTGRWATYGIAGRIFVTVAVFIICFFAIRLTQHSARAMDKNAQIVVETDKLLHLFQPGYFKVDDLKLSESSAHSIPKSQIPALYPEEWLKWGTKNNRAAYYDEYNIALMTLFAITIVIFAWTL